MKPILFLIIMLAGLTCFPIVFSTQMATVGVQTALRADVIQQPDFLMISDVKTTVLYPNLSYSIINQSMTLQTAGSYYFNYTPTVPGEYYVINRYFNSSVLIGTETDTLYAQSGIVNNDGGNMQGLGVIFALSIAIAVFAYLSFAWKSDNNGTTSVWKVFSMIILMLLLVLLGWSSVDANSVCVLTYDAASASGYSVICEDGQFSQGSLFLRLMLLVTVVFFIWISVALFISSMNHLRSTGKM